MKYKIHTKEWFADVRKRADLSMRKLADLAGVHYNTAYYIESGERTASPEIWSKLDKVLYEYVPAAYIDEDALIKAARAYESLGLREGSQCRLYYKIGYESVAFIDLHPDRENESSAPYVVLSWADAIKLLEAQRQAFERE